MSAAYTLAAAVEGSEVSTTTVAPADSESAKSRLSPAVRTRLAVAGACYAVLLLFGAAVAVVRLLMPEWPWAADLGVAAAVAAPFALALIYDRLSALKTPWFEIALTAVTVEVEGRFSRALEEQSLSAGASANPALVAAFKTLLAPTAPKILRINLRNTPYWWSTRVFLLAGLTEDYTAVKRLAFVERGAARMYVGMATPSAVRAVFAARFPDYEPAYSSAKERLASGVAPEWGVAMVVAAWQSTLWDATMNERAPDDADALNEHEESLKQFVTSAELLDWLTGDLDTSYLNWDGWLEDTRLRARILAQDGAYVALVQDGRLDRVVSRDALALAVGRSALGVPADEQRGD